MVSSKELLEVLYLLSELSRECKLNLLNCFSYFCVQQDN
jgi:hypothetical protein